MAKNVKFDDASILAKIEASVKTEHVQQQILLLKKKAFSGNISVKVKAGKLPDPNSIGQEFISVLEGCIAGSLSSAQAAAISGLSVKSSSVSGDTMTVTVGWDGDIYRPSLKPSKYGGVNDLVMLFNDGWSAGGRVVGMWHGQIVQSRQHQGAANFLESARSSFLGKHNGYTVTSISW